MDSWLDEVWCEGGATLDLVNQSLTFFGGEDVSYDPFLREHLLTLYRASWAPWRVKWAHRGIFDLAKAAGVEESVVHSKGKQPATLPKNLKKPRLSSKRWNRCDGLLSVNGRKYCVVEEVSGFLPLGPESLSSLPKKDVPLRLDEYPPRSGATIEEATRRIQFWELSAPPCLEDWLRTAWPGWHVERYEEGATHQVSEFMNQAGQSPPTLNQSIATFREQFLRHVKSRALDLETCHRIHGQEANIELNPLASVDVRPDFKDLDQGAYFDLVVERLLGRNG